ncbi:TVP38/TMEM64 family protein [Methylocystis sp. Sn-Cys]|uniref:TVP38/TMEM64 family protein n=1 Tax=Methylocystis sp. Sn-Cys TaxID=1701263 RepID=UPI0019219C25|nr:TVP38/TMEM64 family protein [Methylocystis sp. Sn-Cys]MBL1255627.1 TVP38/TMEM64 family protein [Methylocystis sp. Sn-Cys]
MRFARYAPILALTVVIAAAFAFRLDRHLTLDAVRDNRALLIAFVQSHGPLSGVVFVAVYAAVVALSLPGSTIMTLTGGFLFGVPFGVMLSVVGATLGATLLFVIARSALGDMLFERAGPTLSRTAKGFRKDAFSYLLFLRLVPAFPFWAVNLAAAALGMRLKSYVAATSIGVIPSAIIYAAFGAGLAKIFDASGEVRLEELLNPSMIGALVGLGLLALLPVALRRDRASQP